MSTLYQFTNNWFDGQARPTWQQLIPQIRPQRILEIGSYEGASTCFLIDHLVQYLKPEIHCVDSWEGGVEHQKDGVAEINMADVEKRFDFNITQAHKLYEDNFSIIKHKSYSDKALIELLADGKQNYFDFIYVDGSHQAPDVLCDAVLGFKLLKVNGIMVFDDYIWSEAIGNEKDITRCPKPSIDAFTNIYCRKINILNAPIGQIYLQKISD